MRLDSLERVDRRPCVHIRIGPAEVTLPGRCGGNPIVVATFVEARVVIAPTRCAHALAAVLVTD